MTKEAAEEILELPRRYTKEDVRRAYTELARRYHPDAAARHHFDPDLAQRRMVEANKANEVLKQEFALDSSRVVTRVAEGIESGFAGVDWRAGAADPDEGLKADPWDIADTWETPVEEQAVPRTVRTVLLGPVVLRVVCIGLLALWWWRVFPLLPHNVDSYVPAGEWRLLDVARLVAAMVYPTYAVAYELISGYVSDLIREVLNGVVSWITRNYVDLRPKTASYGCALYKLIREQVYALLLAPLVVYVVAACLLQTSWAAKVALGVVAALLGVDALAACAQGGFVNVWSAALAEWVENRYLLVRASLLKRCGAWEG